VSWINPSAKNIPLLDFFSTVNICAGGTATRAGAEIALAGPIYKGRALSKFLGLIGQIGEEQQQTRVPCAPCAHSLSVPSVANELLLLVECLGIERTDRSCDADP
jgi:hypothetical protein